MKQHLQISVFGKVQGVGFRYGVKAIADKLDIKGYVRNMRDGSVSIEAVGSATALNEFLKILRSSPGFSNVQNLETEKGPIMHYREFTVY